ncbi:aminotransferase DegT [Pandoraea terrae]|uniref:Aminotransferase DegT n=1 Tax=Pandoraea terrae TaxID=1537710 RepID=A0A5E4Y860_9BURK|nr:DegT/DnrJ/EryC1/StrS family aminotransferase [Pandoraea terrae]VVE44658.1 aminotransferase DegT [Pandoraea terrae]
MEFIDLKAQYRAQQDEIDSRIRAVLDHGRFIMGPEVAELEEKLATYTGARHCVTVASGTEALLIALMAAGVRPGDEVITTPFSFVATAEVIVLVGAKPVFVDIEPDTCNIDVSLIEAKITPRTRAIIPVSLYGQMSDMDEINEIAARHNLVVIEDAAQSFGATYRGKRSGNASTIGCTSFFPSKPLGCYGDGGAIFTSDDALAKAMREIRVHGQEKRYYHTRVGVGGRMDTLQCAIVLGKLPRLEWEVERRIALGTMYQDLLASVDGLVPMVVRSDRTSVHGQFTVRADAGLRDTFLQRLSEAKIPYAIHYPTPIDQQPAYREFASPEGCAASTAAAGAVFSLPMSPDLSEADLDKVIRALKGN